MRSIRFPFLLADFKLRRSSLSLQSNSHDIVIDRHCHREIYTTSSCIFVERSSRVTTDMDMTLEYKELSEHYDNVRKAQWGGLTSF